MSRIAELRQNILKKNDRLAADLRGRFDDASVTAVNLVSGPGSGKTSLLEATLRRLGERHRVAALVGDLATDRDARRLRRAAEEVHQITTGHVCHLDADMVAAAITGRWDLQALDFLFIENVGNLVCPAGYDLGETVRVVLLSVTEGEDKPLKYPTIFNSADLALITKIDLAEVIRFSREEALANVREVAPTLPILELSTLSGAGMDAWIGRLESIHAERRNLSRNSIEVRRLERIGLP